MNRAIRFARRVATYPARRLLRASLPAESELAARIIERSAREDPDLAPLYDLVSDEEARVHFNEAEPIDAQHYRAGIRLFHAWKVNVLRSRLGDRLAGADIVDVGDTDGLLLRDLGKHGIGFNIADSAIRNIRSNGIEAVQGDAHGLPFADASFDVVLCFETLEHVEGQHAVLLELARVCKPGGRCFVSIPSVPDTVVHPRDGHSPRGEQHAFELDRDDFAALVTHTPFTLVFEDTCELFARPHGLGEHLYLRARRRDHIVAGTFRAFRLFELLRA